MSLAITSEKPFGAYRLAPWLEALRNYANTLPNNFYGRRMASLVRRLCVRLGGEGPFDISLFAGQRARVYPTSNRCEKRAFAGVGSWDTRERAYLEGRIVGTDPDRPFVFVDAGANVGFYSLYAQDVAQRMNRPIRILAIEPDPENRARLTFNLAASGAESVAVSPYALGGEARSAHLSVAGDNRGEIRLVSEACPSAGTAIEVATLAQVLADHGISRIDALKLDIEGVEYETLSAFFTDAPFETWPEMIILEVDRSGRSPAFELCRALGYTAMRAGRINSILRRPVQPPERAGAPQT